MYYIARPEHSRWLVLSSCSFALPAIYAIYSNIYNLGGIILFITAAVSAAFWIHAVYSWRRTLDLIVSKISFIIFTYNGIVYICWPPYKIIGYSNAGILCVCFYLSGYYYTKQNLCWINYHIAFHLLMMIELFIIIHSMEAHA
jgi:hypothetical protein